MKKIIVTLFIFIFLILSVQDVYAYGNTISFDKKIGMNGHVDVPQDILSAGGVVREYHNFGWSITEDKKMYFNKYSWWDFDNYYKNLSSKGITILPCIQMGEQSVFNRNRNEKPVIKGDDTTDPMSYKIHSNYLFNYAARYGNTKVNELRLNLDSKETVKTGLGYITYYEDWNEPDKTWQGPDAQFNSTELAAMLSADYDGHEGRLGDTYGIKRADPNSKLVMGGMAGGSTMVTWLNEMQSWANINRTDKKLPLDVINYHQYTSTHSPENSTFVEDAKKIIAWRDSNDKTKEIWITEFGWDTNINSTHAAPSLDTQRDWIIREYLIGDRIGLDRVVVYDALNDGPSSDTTQYSTSGLATNSNEGFIKKSSWYGVNTAKNTLKGFKFKEVIEESNNIYIYKYENDSNEECYVLWSPTENGRIINDYKLNVGNTSSVVKTELKDKEELGINTNLPVKNNEVTLSVSESPIFVKVKKEDKSDNKEDQKTDTDNDKINNDNNIRNDLKDSTQNKEDEKIVAEDKNDIISQIVNIPNTTVTAVGQSIFGVQLIISAIVIIIKSLRGSF